MKVVLSLIMIIFFLMLLFVSIESHDFDGWDYFNKYSKSGIGSPMPDNAWTIITIPGSIIIILFLFIYAFRNMKDNKKPLTLE